MQDDIDNDEDDATIVVCAGPPLCLLKGDEAIENQEDGCPRCRRIIIHDDGTESEYRLLAH